MKIDFARKQVLSGVAFAALGMLAVPAFSQSPEYRRAYDQGYRDGVEAVISQAQALVQAQGPARPRPPEMLARIAILEASYGVQGAVCDARASVQQLVANHRSIEIMANNDLCGDPASGRPKRLFITYRCADGFEHRAVGPEGDGLVLSCR